jgi:gas vesicle protein
MFNRTPSFQKLAWTFVGGLVTGAILGLIYAPMTGKKLQKQIVNKVDDLRKFAAA